MELAELLSHVTSSLDQLRIPYLVTGSMATIAYGEPRLTNDIDLVVRLLPRQVGSLCDAFPEDEFYVSRESAMDSVKMSGQFNILHPKSGLKIDVMVADDSDFNESRFGRARLLSVAPGVTAAFASPEDVILKKLEWRPWHLQSAGQIAFNRGTFISPSLRLAENIKGLLLAAGPEGPAYSLYSFKNQWDRCSRVLQGAWLFGSESPLGIPSLTEGDRYGPTFSPVFVTKTRSTLPPFHLSTL